MTLFRDEHEAFRQQVRSFIERKMLPYADLWEARQELPRSVFSEFGREGLLGLSLPSRYGGREFDFAYNVVLAEELPRSRMLGLTLSVIAQISFFSPLLAAFGTEEQKQEFLAPSIEGIKIGALACTEPTGGSDLVNAVQCTATDDGEFWVITGEKKFITNAPIADFLVTLVRTRPEASPGSLSLVIVPTATPGVYIKDPLRKLGLHTSPTGWVIFDHCRVPKRLTVGKPDLGFFYLQNFLEERLIGSAAGLAAADLVLQETTSYARQRVAFGRRLSGHQVVRHRIVEMSAELEMARCFVHSVCEAFRDGKVKLREICMIKFLAAEIAQRVIESCLQLHGGQGFMEENWVTRAYRDIRLLSVGGGASEVMKDLVASSLRL